LYCFSHGKSGGIANSHYTLKVLMHASTAPRRYASHSGGDGRCYGATHLIPPVDNVTLFSSYFISVCICNLLHFALLLNSFFADHLSVLIAQKGDLSPTCFQSILMTLLTP